jgi:hypothetical protein
VASTRGPFHERQQMAEAVAEGAEEELEQVADVGGKVVAEEEEEGATATATAARCLEA